VTTDLVAQFAALIEQHAAEGASIDLVLGQLERDEAALLRKAAIPHQFNPEVLRVLEPSLTEEQADARFRRFTRLSTVISTPDGAALHDNARQQLFATWLAPDCLAELADISSRLLGYCEQLMDAADVVSREKLRRRYIFHFVAVSQDLGISTFEDEFEAYRDRLRLTACDNLLRLVREYEPVLTPLNRARVTYREAKLVSDRGDAARALQLFAAVRDEPSIDAMLRLKAWLGIGRAHDAARQWKDAADALTEALRVSEQEPRAGGFRCRILQSLASIHRDTGNLDTAEVLLKQSLDLAKAAHDEKGTAIGYNAFGTLYLRGDEPEKAIASLRQSLEHMEPEDFDRSRIYNNLGLAYMRIRNYTESARWFERSLELKRSAGDTIGEANTRNNLVRLHGEQGAMQAAIDEAAKAAGLFERVPAWTDAGHARLTIARMHHGLGQRDAAVAAFGAAIEAFSRAHAEQELAQAKQELQAAVNIKPKKGCASTGMSIVLTVAAVLALISLVMAVFRAIFAG
jgi:tetratricopeptide (TPR) repeat protein